VWKISLEIFKHMEKEGFRFGSDRLVIEVLSEFIAFLIQLADRTVYGKLSEADRTTLVSALTRHLAVTMENNQLDLLGPGDYRKPFIDLMNLRFEEYASFECPGGVPSYSYLRFFASKVFDAMAVGDNKWVMEQMMEIEAPEMALLIKKLIDQTVNRAPR
jgi:hypothetical protein